MINDKFDSIIFACFDEDMPYGDITTESVISDGTIAEGYFVAKDSGIICGLEIAKRVFELAGGNVELQCLVNDGEWIEKGQKIAFVKGDAKTILKGERTALNLMQRASGIATSTANAVKAVEGTNAKITDTRKTMPGLRLLDKYAVRMGGGYNHRTGLSDGVLIKDNHIAAAGGILHDPRGLPAARMSACTAPRWIRATWTEAFQGTGYRSFSSHRSSDHRQRSRRRCDP